MIYRRIIAILFVMFFAVSLSGCTIIFQKGRRSDAEKIKELSRQLDALTAAKDLLSQRMKQEIADKQVSLNMEDKGLVITFVADVLFDSGKSVIKQEAMPSLDKVARVLNENLKGYNIGIEGHTDNQPIKYSGWESNWELSSGRAMSVLHYLIDEQGLSGGRVSAIAYGEYRPIAPNTTKENMQLNRRVEIVVLPNISKVNPMPQQRRVSEPQKTSLLREPEENLK